MQTSYSRSFARLTRRELLNVAWKLGAAAALSPTFARGSWVAPAFRRYPFALGVASGDPLPDGFVIWTRLAPEPLEPGGGMPMRVVEVDWEIAIDRDMHRVVRRGTALARPELGHSVHVELAGLEPDRPYWYRFSVGAERSQRGRARTAPAVNASPERLRFALCGCSNYKSGHFTAYRRIAEGRFDFVFHAGDYIYESRAHGGEFARVREHLGEETYTLTDYRNRYAQYRSDPDLRAAHASAPFVVTFDDHEVDNDWSARADEEGTPAEVFALRRAAALQAWYEAMPVRRAAFPAPGGVRVHRQLRFGDLLALNALDTRQFRSPQSCVEDAFPPCFADPDPARTLLGHDQERWLEKRLAAGGARWNALAQQVPMFGFSGAGLSLHELDQWAGYPAARRRLIDAIERHAAGSVVVLSGDAHVHWGANLPRRAEEPDGPAVAVEVTTTSISSGGDGSDEASYWGAVREANPHVHYHSDRRGFVACEVTRGAWRNDFMVLDNVRRPEGRLTKGGSFVVERGDPSAHAV